MKDDERSPFGSSDPNMTSTGPQSASSDTFSNPDTSSTPPASDPSAPNQIISSAGLPTATPLNAPLPTDPLHPTQTVASGSGDVIIKGSNPGAKKPLIIAAIVGAVALFGLLLLLPMLLRSDNEKVLTLFQQNLEPTEQIESFFQEVYFREKTTKDIMNSETHDMLNQNIGRFVDFQNQLTKINIDKVQSDVRDDVKKVQDLLAKQSEKFKQSVDLYNVLYTVYETENAEPLGEYLASVNYTVATAAERFDEFLREKKSLLTVIDANNCLLDGNSIAEICAEIVPEYHGLLDSMEQSFSVPQAIFFAYDEADEIIYDEENAVVDAMRRVIEKLEE